MHGPVMLDLKERFQISRGRNTIENFTFERNLTLDGRTSSTNNTKYPGRCLTAFPHCSQRLMMLLLGLVMLPHVS